MPRTFAAILREGNTASARQFPAPPYAFPATLTAFLRSFRKNTDLLSHARQARALAEPARFGATAGSGIVDGAAAEYRVGRTSCVAKRFVASHRFTVTLITETNLQEFVARAKAFPEFDGAKPHVRLMALALDVICMLLGPTWYRDHLSQRPVSRYFRSNSQNDDDARRYLMRFTRFAENLYAAQSLPGFDERVTRWRSYDPESLVGELEAVRMLIARGLSCSFVPETGQLGTDYDLDLHWKAHKVCVEIKAKGENTAVATASILQTLKDARKQVPPNRPSLICVWLPETWATSPVLEPTLMRAAAEFFRNTQRVAGFIVHFARYLGGIGEQSFFQVDRGIFANPNCDTIAPADAILLHNALDARTINVLAFSEFIDR